MSAGSSGTVVRPALLLRVCVACQPRSRRLAKTFHLRLLLAGQDDLICEVRKPEADRLKQVLGREEGADCFFWFDTIDGRSILVNTAYLQGVRYLWDVAAAPPDSRISADDNMNIALCGKELLSEPLSEDPKNVYNLFWELELGPTAAVTFIDGDGEPFTLISRQVVYITAPKQVVDEGRRQVNEEDGLGDN